MLFSVFDLWILIDKCHLCVPTVHCGGTSRYNMCKNHSNTRSSCAITLKINPPLCHEADAALKKNHACYVLQINTNIKFTIKYTPIQHSARSGKRCTEVTNLDEYKNITTCNVFFVFFCCPSWTSRLIR